MRCEAHRLLVMITNALLKQYLLSREHSASLFSVVLSFLSAGAGSMHGCRSLT